MTNLRVALVDLDGLALPSWVPQRIAKEGIELVVRDCKTSDEIVTHARTADILWVLGTLLVIKAETLRELPRCGAIIRSGSGTDNIPVEEATQLGIAVANTPDAHSEAVADHTLGLLLSLLRQIPHHDRNLRRGVWDRTLSLQHRRIGKKTLGFVGFGRIPRILCRRLAGFEMKFLAYDPKVKPDVLASHKAHPCTLQEVLSQSDFISIHCPLVPETCHLIRAAEIRLMKKEAILVNTSRGAVIDQQALATALSEGRIAGAGIDVFEEEPVDPGHPLLQLQNVVVTPHVGGVSEDTDELRWRLSVETIVALGNGHWPPSCVNPDVTPKMNLGRSFSP